MAGLKNPIGDPLQRGGKKSGGVRIHRSEGAQTYEENLHAEAEEERRRRKQ